MEGQVISGVTAVVLGVMLGVLLFVPFVAVSYRRHGRFSVGRALTWATALVYGWAVWTYTLLPLPDPDAIQCAGSNTRPFAFIADISDAVAGSGGHPLATLTSPVVLQVVLNVLLFVPLGFFVRVLGNRGVVAAVVVGLALSALIEVTQLTGVWGLYPCAYRVFDVDDMLVNTLGALIGSVLALLLVPRRRHNEDDGGVADVPRPVTRPRRLLAMVSDWLGFILVSSAAAVGVQAYLLYVLNDRETVLEGRVSTLVGASVALVVWTVVTLSTGRTIGDHAVQLTYAGGPLPAVPARLLRLLGGVGAYGALSMQPPDESGLATLFAVVALVTTLVTPRGLPGLLSRQQIEDARPRRSG